MDLRRTILPLRSFPKLLLIISTITITAGFKLKQNGCLPLNSGKHPCLNLNYSFFIQCPENWVHINTAGRFAYQGLVLTGLATATTAASGGNREELLGPRPAGCERQRSRRWEPQPGQWQRVSADGEVELLSQRESLCLRGLREFVENARVKREEFVNVIKMRRRY